MFRFVLALQVRGGDIWGAAHASPAQARDRSEHLQQCAAQVGPAGARARGCFAAPAASAAHGKHDVRKLVAPAATAQWAAAAPGEGTHGVTWPQLSWPQLSRPLHDAKYASACGIEWGSSVV